MKKKSGDKQLDTLTAYHNVFETEDGKTVLYDLMEKSRFFSSTVGGSPEITARNEGQRELVVFILSELKKDISELKEFIDQQEEQKNDYRQGL